MIPPYSKGTRVPSGQGDLGGQKETQPGEGLGLSGAGGVLGLVVFFFEKSQVLFFRNDKEREREFSFCLPGFI